MPGAKAMAEHGEAGTGWRRRRWRLAAWSVAALLLLLPLVAMQFTDEVNWSLADFVVFGALWLASVWLFRRAALEQAASGAAR